jgi:hypothetical protein
VRPVRTTASSAAAETGLVDKTVIVRATIIHAHDIANGLNWLMLMRFIVALSLRERIASRGFGRELSRTE